MVTFRHMCDRCYRMVGDNEKMFAFKLIDDENVERIFKGHKECMDDMVTIMTQLYGTKEKKDNE